MVDEDLTTPVTDPAIDDEPVIATCVLPTDPPSPVAYLENPCAGSIILANRVLLDLVGGVREVESEVDGEWLPKVALEYNLSDDQLLYASASKAIRNGGTNSTFVVATAEEVPGEAVAFSEDSMWAYELGFKSTWLDSNLTLNMAAFTSVWMSSQSL